MVNIFFKTYGCQANVADSQGLITYLEGLGCSVVDAEQKADLIVINSCAIREKAEQKMFSYLGSLAALKQERPYIRIGVIGCVASYRKKEIYERYDHVTFVFGAREELGTFHAYLVDLVVKLESAKQLLLNDPQANVSRGGQDRDIKQVVTKKKLRSNIVSNMPATQQLSSSKLERRHEVKRSFINITTGCNNYCSYCIVPFTRGREKSYSIKYIVDRVAREVAEGAKEVTLIGQNVNSYTDPDNGAGFASLLEHVAQVPGEFWVRYISPHPKDMTKDVLETMAMYPEKLCAWVHLPLQAGSDRVLELMKRTYTVDRYMEIVEWIRQELPKATITTDIIVGFPGETQEEYEGTRKVMERVRYDLIYSFIYSRRKYTPAYNMGDPTPHEVKQERLSGLQKRHLEVAHENNKKYIGTAQRVLIEKRLTSGKLQARTSGNHRVQLDGEDDRIGTFSSVMITGAGSAHLDGEFVV